MNVIIKKQTMIMKNQHDINEIYEIEKGVSNRGKLPSGMTDVLIITVGTGKWNIRSRTIGHP